MKNNIPGDVAFIQLKNYCYHATYIIIIHSTSIVSFQFEVQYWKALVWDQQDEAKHRKRRDNVTRVKFMNYKTSNRGFPGGAVVESLPAKTGDAGSSPGLGRPHMPRSNWAREPQLLSLRVCSLCSTTRDAAMVRGPRTAIKSGPHLPQLEKAITQKRRPNTAMNR